MFCPILAVHPFTSAIKHDGVACHTESLSQANDGVQVCPVVEW